MKGGTKQIGILFLSLVIVGCSTKVAERSLFGRFVASYPFGTDTLILNRDGSFLQEVVIKNGRPVTVHGRWSFDQQASYAHFHGLMIVDDGHGNLSNDWRTPTSILVEMDVEMHWFRIVMASAARYPYVKP